MKVKHILIASAIVLFLFGIGFLFFPVWTMGLFDLTLEPAGIMMTRLLAACFLGIATINWIGRNYVVAEDVRSLIVGNCVMDTIGFFVVLIQFLNGLGNNLTWLPILLYLFFGLTFGYSIFDKRTYEEPTVQAKHA